MLNPTSDTLQLGPSGAHCQTPRKILRTIPLSFPITVVGPLPRCLHPTINYAVFGGFSGGITKLPPSRFPITGISLHPELPLTPASHYPAARNEPTKPVYQLVS